MQKKKASLIMRRLKKEYSEYHGEFVLWNTKLELLVATILSAQTTDKKVNEVTPELFKKYKTAEDYSKANLNTLRKHIKQVNFYKTKAKNIKNAGKIMVEEFNGKVPDTMEDLIKLPGVARKTANLILQKFHKQNHGVAVDTHVRRVSYRLGFTKHQDPNKIEKDLMETLAKKDWYVVNPLMISHGRKVCKAPIPKCSECILRDICPRKGVTKSS